MSFMMPYFWEKDKEHGEKTRRNIRNYWEMNCITM